MLWRIFTVPTGIDGRYHTDRGWFTPATKVLHPSGRASRLHKGRRIIHVSVRTGVPLVLLAIVCGLLVARMFTLIVLAVAAAAAVVDVSWRTWRRARFWQHHRHYVAPLEARLVHITGHAPELVHVDRDGEAVKAVEITWPAKAEIAPADEPQILEAVTTRLAIEAPEPDRSNFKGRNRTVRYVQSTPPPANVTLRDLRAAIEGSGPDEIVAGLGRRGTAVPVDLHSDSPHVALSIGSPAAGRPSRRRALAVQVLRKGGLVVVLNLKKTGYNWTRGLPNVCHCKTVEDIAAMLLWLNAERKRREDVAEVPATSRTSCTPTSAPAS